MTSKIERKTMCISVEKKYYKAIRKEAIEREIRISSICTEMLKERYGEANNENAD